MDNVTDQMVEAADAPEYLIRKRGYYYRPNYQGYTANPDEAGRYTLDDATRICHPNGLDGPRDGMDCIHQSKVETPVRQSTASLQAKLDAAETRVEKLEEALKAYENHMSNGQNIVGRYLVPAVDPSSIEVSDFINRMIEHFDGPAQRKVQYTARRALGYE